jgi:drug/metabolite transporter (DMT)-like permease
MTDAQVRARPPMLMPAVFVLLWSTGFIVAKYAAPHAPPLAFLLWRYAAVVVVLLPLVVVTAAPWPHNPAAWLHVAVAGVLLQATYLGGVWWAIAEGMPAGASALIVGLQPLLTAFFARAVGERATGRQWLGLVLGFGGVALVLSDRLTLQGVGAAPLAVNILALAGITAGTLYQKRFCAGVDLRTASSIQFGAAFLATLPFALLDGSMQVDFAAEFWFALAWSVLVLSLVAMVLLLTMIRRGRATEVASLMYLTPPATALLAWWLFGEALGLLAWLGVVVAMSGVALVLHRRDAT